MSELKMHSINNVNENIEKIIKLFPNCLTERIKKIGENQYTEHAIDFDKLRQELSEFIVEGNDERYQFTWPDKKNAELLANAPISKTLRPCRAESFDFDKTKNLYIEGDNLDVLKLLQETYLGKIKMIYIDPPYNTQEDFIYNDKFSQSVDEYLANSGQFDEEGNRLVKNTESKGRLHTDWLNMIYPRLKVARNVLADDGVIFISIDDNEFGNLKKVCDEVFGEKNHAATFLWTKTYTPPALSNKTRKTVEYILVYEKNMSSFKYFGTKLENGDAPLLNTGNLVKTLEFPPKTVHIKFLKEGTINSGQKEKIIIENDIFVKDGLNLNSIRLTGEFKWGQSTLENEIEQGTYFIVKTDKFSIRFQRMEDEEAYKTPNNFLNSELNNDIGVGSNETGIKELKKYNLNKFFDYPKPTSLIKKLIEMICKNNKDSIILDFFSGSATTAHAVMQQNSEDGGDRKFIMVQLPEEIKDETINSKYKTICDIGKKRISEAGKELKEKSPNLDTGFRVLKLDSSNMNDVYYEPKHINKITLDFMQENIKNDRTPEDLLFQVMLDLGVSLSSKIEQEIIGDKKLFTVEDGYLIACFDKEVTEEIIKEIAIKKPYYFVMRDSSMANDSVATNFEQIFVTYSPDTIKKVL